MTFLRAFKILLLVVSMLIGSCTNQPDVIHWTEQERLACVTLLAQIPLTPRRQIRFAHIVLQFPDRYPNMEARLERCIEIWDAREPNTEQLQMQRNRMQDFFGLIDVNARRNRPNQPHGNNAPRAPVQLIPQRPAQVAQRANLGQCLQLLMEHEHDSVQMPVERIRGLVPECIALWNQRLSRVQPGNVWYERLTSQLRLLETIQQALRLPPRLTNTPLAEQQGPNGQVQQQDGQALQVPNPNPPNRSPPRNRGFDERQPNDKDTIDFNKVSSSSTFLWIVMFSLALVIGLFGGAIILWIWWHNTASNGAISCSQASDGQFQSSQAT